MKLTLQIVTALTFCLYFVVRKLNDAAIDDFTQENLEGSKYLPQFDFELSPYLNIGIILLCEYLLGWNNMYIPLIYGGAILIPLMNDKSVPFSMTYQMILTLSLWTQKWIPFFISFFMIYGYDYYQEEQHEDERYQIRLNNNIFQSIVMNLVPFFYFVLWKQKYTWVQSAIFAMFLLWFVYRYFTFEQAADDDDRPPYQPLPEELPLPTFHHPILGEVADLEVGEIPLPGTGYGGFLGEEAGISTSDDEEEEDGHVPFEGILN